MNARKGNNCRILKVPPSCKVYTPLALAQAMAATLGNEASDKWLEPSVGTGALLSALRAQNVSEDQITGLDLDPNKQELDALARVNRGVEFLSWSLSTRKRFDKIICNPPYVAIEKLQDRVRRSACRIRTLNDVKVSASANLWYAFLCAAINLLRNGGSLCFVLPAAWDFANYARPLREQIASAFDRVEVYRCGEPLFRAAAIQDGAVVLVARCKRYPDKNGQVQPDVSVVRKNFSKGATLIRSLRRVHCEPPFLTPLRSENGTRQKLAAQSECASLHFEDVAAVHLGGVTGDAGYFLLTEAERLEWGLPVFALRPVVTKARHLACASIGPHQWHRLRDLGERIWLFHPSRSALAHPAVQFYLAYGKKEGCNIASHKISNRADWYRTPLPKRVDAFVSGMSQYGPWLAFSNMPRLSASNTLYVIEFKKSDAQYNAAVALSLLSSYVRNQLPALGRHYADGLVKFEPGDLRKLRLHLPATITPAKAAYRLAIESMLSGKMNSAIAIADAYCNGTLLVKSSPRLVA